MLSREITHINCFDLNDYIRLDFATLLWVDIAQARILQNLINFIIRRDNNDRCFFGGRFEAWFGGFRSSASRCSLERFLYRRAAD